MPNPFLIATRKGSARLHNTLCGLRQQFCFICTVLWRFLIFFFFNDIRELQAPKESFKVKSESETVPEECKWPFRPSSPENLSQWLAEKAHLLTKTRKRQKRTFSNTRSSLLGTGDDYPDQPSVRRVTEIPISALEDNWFLPWCNEKRNHPRSGSPTAAVPLSSHVLSRWEPYFCTHPCSWWAGPFKQAPECHPSSFIRETIGSQLSGDGPRPLKLIKMSSYCSLQAVGTGSCLWRVSHYWFLPSLALCQVTALAKAQHTRGKMTPNQATQENKQVEQQHYCWDLTTAFHHQ